MPAGDGEGKRLALIGANGMLAQAVKKAALPHYETVSFDLPEFDLTDRQQVLSALTDLRPQVIINCAAFTNVDGCETQEELATRVNGSGPGYLAEAAKSIDAVLVHISTDYVFDGSKTTPYTEEDRPHPVSAYGRSKLAGEEAIRSSGFERYFILRTSWLYGSGGKNFVETIIRLAAEREELRVVADQVGSPTHTEDLAVAIFKLLTSQAAYGIYHFANLGECSWHAFAEAIVDELRQRGMASRVKQIVPLSTDQYPLPARRPAYSVFSRMKYQAAAGPNVPDWRTALHRYFDLRG
jgi:dTDP-4-dehydrorhamnose reductase